MKPSDFKEFHSAIHGFDPFPWQQRLLEQVVAERRWPEILDLPTGCGKTTCLDIALFAMALDADEPAERRWCPRRIAMVVDRRVVVDQAAERGRKILRALSNQGASGILAETASRLKSLSRESEDPVGVFTLRGGIPKDDGWARTPDQPLLLASTVDQIGSRMLLQGYGVSRGMKPVHAGLLANDLLLFLDEVHLSRPFAETLQALGALRERFRGTTELPRRFAHVFLSATPGRIGSKIFRLSSHDRAQSTLAGRLKASKPTRFESAGDRQSLEEKCVEAAAEFLAKHDVVAVVLNRVSSAASVHRNLRERVSSEINVVLLTGRMRPLDRDDVLRANLPRLRAGRKRGNGVRKLALVATQCIEAGADFDVDALVSESASLDALRQRFGRLNRLGEYSAAEAVIVHDKSQKDDPIYGEALECTVEWIKSRLDKKKRIDFGIEALPIPDSDSIESFLAPKKQAPVLMPAYMDLWMQTAPPPAQVPDVSLWLHGPESGPADVQIVWRADLGEAQLAEARARNDVPRLVEIVGAIRPSSLEALPVPLGAARKWLAGGKGIPIADVEGRQVNPERNEAGGDRTVLALRWDGDESEIVDAASIRPGDTLVVPSTLGGLCNGTFDPEDARSVQDLAERSALLGRGRAMLRLLPADLPGLQRTVCAEEPDEIREALEQEAAVEEIPWRKAWLEALSTAKSPRVWSAGDGRVIEGRRLSPARLREALGDELSLEHGVDLTTDEEDSSHVGRPVALQAHSADVERFAREYGTKVGLPKGVVEDLALAGWLHDVGKADRRFQILLRNGSELEYLKDETPLAKSGIPSEAKEAQRIARVRSGYPQGARHEVQSLAMLERNLHRLREKARDIDLVLHLVASHHGWCRPFAPVATDDRPLEVGLKGHASAQFGTLDLDPATSAHGLHRLDSQIAGRFWKLVERYGWLELCWLESILRLADHRASEEESQS